jgi:hypothetical protein
MDQSRFVLMVVLLVLEVVLDVYLIVAVLWNEKDDKTDKEP